MRILWHFRDHFDGIFVTFFSIISQTLFSDFSPTFAWFFLISCGVFLVKFPCDIFFEKLSGDRANHVELHHSKHLCTRNNHSVATVVKSPKHFSPCRAGENLVQRPKRGTYQSGITRGQSTPLRWTITHFIPERITVKTLDRADS